jgi:phosphohistidine phosphatase
MTIRIWVLRHGEAVRNAADDPGRALTERGAQHAHAAGIWLATITSADLRVLASPYVRAQQTAQQVLQSFPGKTLTTMDWLVPDLNPLDVVTELAKISDGELLLVSHQPLVSALTGLLVAADYRAGPPMETASLAELSLPIIAPGMATLVSLRHAPDYSRAVTR